MSSVTLAQLEQETARRVGPYRVASADRQVPTTASFDFVLCPSLRSNVDLDSVTNLWLLRRGIDAYGNPVAMDPADRQRVVSAYDPQLGRVFPDRPWATIPVPAEIFEFHHLDPQQELLPIVQSGLRRCFFDDTVQVVQDNLYGMIDLTAQLPWMQQPWQVQRAWYGWYGWPYPYGDAPFDCHLQGGHVILTGASGYYFVPGGLWVGIWRPAWSLINGATSDTGPTGDFDTIDGVDLDYAASAAHIQAWHLLPSRLQAAAAGGNQATQAMAAAEFARQVSIWGPAAANRFGFQDALYAWTIL